MSSNKTREISNISDKLQPADERRNKKVFFFGFLIDELTPSLFALSKVSLNSTEFCADVFPISDRRNGGQQRKLDANTVLPTTEFNG